MKLLNIVLQKKNALRYFHTRLLKLFIASVTSFFESFSKIKSQPSRKLGNLGNYLNEVVSVLKTVTLGE